MTESFVDKATKLVPDTQKQNIGKLIVVNAGESEPARKLHYTSALITHIRSALFYIVNNAIDREFDDLLHKLVYNILKSEYDPNDLKYTYGRLRDLFEGSKKTKYDMQLMSDIALIQQCRNNWRAANKKYFENEDGWQNSNDMLADIQDTLVEIALRWNLIIIPKDMPFNISSMPNLTMPMVPQQQTPLDQ